MIEALMIWNESRVLPRALGGISPLDASFIKNMETQGVLDPHASPPHDIDELADFCARMTRRYAAG